MASQTVSDLLGAIEHIGPLIAEHAAAAEANRQLSGAVYQAMYDAGLFAMVAPKAYGGLELYPTDCIRVWEAVARIDAAAAWNLVMNQAVAAYSAWLPPKGVAELFATGIPTVAGRASSTRQGDTGRWRLEDNWPGPVRKRLSSYAVAGHTGTARGRRCPLRRVFAERVCHDPRQMAHVGNARHRIGRYNGD